MTPERAKELLPIITAYANGATVEVQVNDGQPSNPTDSLWQVTDMPSFTAGWHYRVKPGTEPAQEPAQALSEVLQAAPPHPLSVEHMRRFREAQKAMSDAQAAMREILEVIGHRIAREESTRSAEQPAYNPRGALAEMAGWQGNYGCALNAAIYPAELAKKIGQLMAEFGLVCPPTSRVMPLTTGWHEMAPVMDELHVGRDGRDGRSPYRITAQHKLSKHTGYGQTPAEAVINLAHSMAMINPDLRKLLHPAEIEQDKPKQTPDRSFIQCHFAGPAPEGFDSWNEAMDAPTIVGLFICRRDCLSTSMILSDPWQTFSADEAERRRIDHNVAQRIKAGAKFPEVEEVLASLCGKAPAPKRADLRVEDTVGVKFLPGFKDYEGAVPKEEPGLFDSEMKETWQKLERSMKAENKPTEPIHPSVLPLCPFCKQVPAAGASLNQGYVECRTATCPVKPKIVRTDSYTEGGCAIASREWCAVLQSYDDRSQKAIRALADRVHALGKARDHAEFKFGEKYVEVGTLRQELLSNRRMIDTVHMEKSGLKSELAQANRELKSMKESVDDHMKSRDIAIADNVVARASLRECAKYLREILDQRDVLAALSRTTGSVNAMEALVAAEKVLDGKQS